MPAANLCQIVFDDEVLKVTREPVASNTPELYPKAAIAGVFPQKINSKQADGPVIPNSQYWTYRFNSKITIVVEMSDGNNFVFDIQEVTNQISWTPNLAGQQQAVEDFNTWLSA